MLKQRNKLRNTLTFLRYLGYDFCSTVSQTWLWNERKIRIQSHVGFTATRKMKAVINLRDFVICIHGLSFSCGLLSTNNRFHHADERIFILFTTSPSIEGTFPWFLKAKHCLKPKVVLYVFLFFFSLHFFLSFVCFQFFFCSLTFFCKV